ncbi:MAG: OadG family protein [Synergistaceae bacterium]|jgi:sodium pump decarboxylase gamma subunit|nr:OadG family protein [Clostridiaceae bacterium]NLX75665.1 OadG family protein [Synergistaceae bacterium]
MDFQNLSMLDALWLSIFSIVVVFLVLLIISYMIDLVKILLYRKKNKKNDDKPDDNSPISQEKPSEPADQPDSKTAAIIAAAVSAFLGKDSRFVIRKINRHKAPLSEWEAAGILDTQRRSL